MLWFLKMHVKILLFLLFCIVISSVGMYQKLLADTLPQMEYMSIPAGSFVPTSEEGTYKRNSVGRLVVPNGSLDSTFVAGVSLPDAATIHELSVHFIDGTSCSGVIVVLSALRRNLNDPTTPLETVKLAKISSSGEDRLVTLLDENIQTELGFNPVDNRNVSYNLKLSLLPGSSFFGVTIAYSKAN